MIPFLARLFSKPSELPKPQEPPHVHSFELIAKTIAEPRNPNLTIENTQHQCGAMIPRSIYLGSTSYLWECECGELRKAELMGSEESTLPNILQKVDEQGTVSIVRDGKKYLVGVVAEEKPLPIR